MGRVMQQKIANAIRQYGLISEGETVVAGVSGGADSVALLIVLSELSAQLGFTVRAAHLNHGIRGQSAERDAAFVAQLCATRTIPLLTECVDVPRRAKERGETIEQAARILRYEFLERARTHFCADSIAVAHHMDDQAESILLHLTRGTGLSGLVGMLPRRGNLIRPMLKVRRNEIEQFLSDRGMSYCTDETNLELNSTRNRLRLDVIPYIEANINPRIVESLCATGELTCQDEQYLMQQSIDALDKASLNGGFVRDKLIKLPMPILSRAIRLALAQAGAPVDIERSHVQQVVQLLSARTGTMLDLPRITAWTSYELIFFGHPPAHDNFCITLNMAGQTRTPNGIFTVDTLDGNTYERDPFTAYMDADNIAQALTVRTRLNGDRFYPIGAPGRRKLKDFFIDKKIPREMRELPLVCSDEVLFIPGFCVSELVKVTCATRHMLKVAYSPESNDTTASDYTINIK